jgi:hypothetical protein
MNHSTTFLAGAIALAALGAPAHARAAAAAMPLFQIGAADDAIVRSFRSVLGRNPSDRELLRYRALMLRYGWSERDVRNDLSGRTDYQRYRNDTGTRPNAAIRRAYLDILGREPDPDGLRAYRQNMVRDGWTEQDVREALRKSDEYANIRGESAERIVRRAYLDVLKREPDPEGLAAYRQQVLENGWEYHDVRMALQRSPERRQTTRAIRESDAQEMVRRAYREVLNREPDASGLQSYTARIIRDGLTEAELVRELRESDEYRNR